MQKTVYIGSGYRNAKIATKKPQGAILAGSLTGVYHYNYGSENIFVPKKGYKVKKG